MAATRFREDFRQFRAFLRRPHLRHAPRSPGLSGMGATALDWTQGLDVRRLLCWAACLWFSNIFVLGPLVLMAIGAGGATHRLDMNNIPWLAALAWAPLVEELLFRYGLRRPFQSLWLLPAMLAITLLGPKNPAIVAVVVVLVLLWLPASLGKWLWRRGCALLPKMAWRSVWAGSLRAGRWRWLRRYRRAFPWLFHLSVLLFAGMHWMNYEMNQMPLWLMPLLVLPQWLTGLVLAWNRVRHGIASSILLHAIFNSGPLLLIALFMLGGADLS
ncbi:CPBP family glutamic-type intramembrane protease [Corticimicrobacter populi]|uniref:CPBP family intramembrane metalloprotease n=1 Tax=Corticimicrobacter populi TaxID=2175229 RepID=A0A2V1JWE4_9BURK|nr:CPBP family glutamic-type intramembrane protease [Corticimicrobacter populi]PWF22655.1 CPBP family intramembrane metalloprotease [Corticimicrobacter populi]